MTTRRMAHTATPLGDGRVVVAGGWSDSTDPPESTAAVEAFDPATMSFTALPRLAQARHDHGAARAGDCAIVVVGGLEVRADGSSATPLAIERIDLAAVGGR